METEYDLERFEEIVPAKAVCPLRSCKHHMLHAQIFHTKNEMVVTDFVREAGGCMCQINGEQERAGVCGIRQSASQEEIAEIYGVALFSVQYSENKAMKKIRKKFGIIP